MSYYIRAFQNYVNFKGRDSRKQYWMFVLFDVIIAVVIGVAASFVLPESVANGITGLYSLALFLPSLAITVRRLHDTGRSGWWFLLTFTVVGSIVLFIMLCTPSQEGENKYGDVPEA